MNDRPLSLFEGYGIELEYAIVDTESLDVRPFADRALHSAAGDWVSDFDDGEIGWSNELVQHLIELKTNGPVPRLDGVAQSFQFSVERLNEILDYWDAMLLPSGMHPWMRPPRETKLWSREYADIYRTYDKIFDCRRHGWANVQSMHLNLPFSGEDEFGRLLAATRLLLPILPALAASSPIVEGRRGGWLDTRLDFYRSNATRVPSMAGAVVPEPVFGFESYRRLVLDPITEELAPLDTSGAIAGNEWTNARGIIARFDRMALEIRVLDTQECPLADLAIAAAVSAAARAIVEERWAPWQEQREWAGEPLAQLLWRCAEHGPAAAVDARYAAALGAPQAETAGALWSALVESTFDASEELQEPIALILEEGTLAQRILTALGPRFSPERLAEVYSELAGCLATGRLFDAST